MIVIFFILIIVAVILYYTFKAYNHPADKKYIQQIPIPSPTITVEYNSPNEYKDEYNPDKDAWEGAFWDASNPLPVKAILKFDYIDGNGNKTFRTVDVREYDEELYTGIMIGHCRFRDATRTFRFDRISNCIDIETGEVIDDVRAFLCAKYEASPEATLNKIFHSHQDVLKVLLFLSKADGRTTVKERAIILDYAKEITGDMRLDDTMIKQVFMSIDVPSLYSFKVCCGRIAKTIPKAQQQLLIATVELMVSSENTIHPSEQTALEYIYQRLNQTVGWALPTA